MSKRVLPSALPLRPGPSFGGVVKMLGVVLGMMGGMAMAGEGEDAIPARKSTSVTAPPPSTAHDTPAPSLEAGSADDYDDMDDEDHIEYTDTYLEHGKDSLPEPAVHVDEGHSVDTHGTFAHVHDPEDLDLLFDVAYDSLEAATPATVESSSSHAHTAMADDDDDEEDHDHGDGQDHGDGGTMALPKTPAEVEAFVRALRTADEDHDHGHGPAKAAEHMAALDLVPRAEATHIAIGNGGWNDPSNWYQGRVPGDGAKVLIPEGVHMYYGAVKDTELFTVRVDGHLQFLTQRDSKMIVDTMVIAPGGELTIGTEDNPVNSNVDVDIIFANNGRIDTDWDPMLLSRGLISHGETTIHGATKDSHEKVAVDPMKGQTWVDMGTLPEGWEVGDKIVIAGTQYYGYKAWNPSLGYWEPQDEIRIIRDIKDGKVFFNDPLKFNHAGARDDLKTSVANYTRNISFESEGRAQAEVHERGHVMFMHNDDVDVRYAEFLHLGRTDKSDPARNVDEFDDIAFDSNVKGRYSFHLHRAGVSDQDDPAMVVGNAVFDSPGWGYVHHDSNAILDNNASYRTFGAGYVAESGNETGAWNDNIAIFAKGTSWKDPKLGNDEANFDLGKSGDGFWFQSRMVDSTNNIAASVNNGFVYFHRGDLGINGQMRFDASVSDIPVALAYHDFVYPDDHPILSFYGNESFAAKTGLYVVKSNPQQGHDVHSTLEDFTAWNVRIGADLSYTSHYTLTDFDLVGNQIGWGQVGITFGSNLSDMTLVDTRIENFDLGMRLNHHFTTGATPDQHKYTIISSTFIDVDKKYDQYDRTLDTIISKDKLPYLKPDLVLDGPLIQREYGIILKGTKTDSLGVTDFPTGFDNFSIGWERDVSVLEHEGYFTNPKGVRYFMLDILFSDRLTGDIYMEKYPVFLAKNISTDGITYHGDRAHGELGTTKIDDAILWATFEEGEMILTDQARRLEELEEEMLHMDDAM